MRNRRSFIERVSSGLMTIAVLAGTMVVPVMAHDSSLHKGKATKGDVLSVTKDRLQIKTPKGVKTVLVTENTKLEHGDKTATLTDLKEGDSVSVIGTTLATGEISAREIMLEPEGSQKAAGEGHPAGHKH